MKLDLKQAKNGLMELLSHKRFVLVGLAAALIAVLGAIWIANAKLINFIFSSNVFSFGDKISATFKVFGSTLTTFSWEQNAVIAVNAILFGLNVAVTSLYVSRRYKVGRTAGTGVFGAAIAIFGFGCASCGSVLLAFVFGSTATAAIISNLPLAGLEFGILGAMIMALSVAYSSAKIPVAEACAIPPQE